MKREELIAIARGDRPAELVLRGGRLVNVLAGEVHPADIAIAGGLIAGIGSSWTQAETVIDLDGAHVAPALIEGHLHVESTLLAPFELARAVSARGTGTMVTDPHEIANVHGLEGVRWMLEDARGAPAEMLVMASSCVPASALETSGAELDAGAIAHLLELDAVIGLAELMDFPAAIAGAPQVLAKLEAASGLPVDGHAPGLSGRDLAAYAAGPGSEHEATTLAEAREKLRLGMRVMLREGTPARDLEALLPLITPANSRRLMLVNDDVSVADLLERGHLDHHLRLATRAGVDAVIAVQMATINVAEWFGLADRGAIAPGRRADVVVFDDLEEFRASLVLHGGEAVARDGECLVGARRPTAPASSVRIDLDRAELAHPVPAGARARVIEVSPDAIVTGAGEVEAPVRGGQLAADPARDLALLAVIERHGRGSGASVALVRGLGLAEGAIASTVAHDHHNLIAAGCTLAEIEVAARRLVDLRGGFVAVLGEDVLAELALPIAGLMSAEPAPAVRDAHAAAIAAARRLGSSLADPFMTLSFLGLEVVPSLKLTDVGLVDVDAFRLVEPVVE